MSEETLKPCPFCGGKAEFVRNLMGTAVGVECNNCGADTPSFHRTKIDAAHQWNRRY